MIEIETTGEYESNFYIFEKTPDKWNPYRIWDGIGYYDRKHAKSVMLQHKQAFPEVEFALFRVTIEKDDD